MDNPSYEHSQALKALWLVLPLSAAALGLLAWTESDSANLQMLAGIIVLHGVLLIAFGRLKIAIGQGALQWSFGWLGLPRWQVTIADIRGADLTTSRWTEGWGIRFTREGMLYNASGNQCVRLTLKNGRSLRLGTDDPERLMAFITARMTPHGQSR